MEYFRPIVQTDPCRPADAPGLAGGWAWFEHVEHLRRGGAARRLHWRDLPAAALTALTAARPDWAGLSMAAPRIMGILNVTPDSFSDGGQFDDPAAAMTHAARMRDAGADILDIGGESTRPGADPVAPGDEIARVVPVIAAVAAAGPVSIDTRNADTARAAIRAGAGVVNDVSAFGHDPAMAAAVAGCGAAVVLMHSQGSPQEMQRDPRYDDVLLDVYDHLAERIAGAVRAGIRRDRIAIDPGIGFGKTKAHNLALLRGLSLFHGLGVPIVLGVSRKGFIGVIGHAREPADRMPGSVATGLAAVAQGVQILRVHDVAATGQALRLWQAVTAGQKEGRDI